MKRHLAFLLALLPLLLAAQVGDLPRSTPAAEGITTQAVISMMDSLMALPECDIHHVMVVRHGKVVAELHPAPFRAEDSHTLYSASKTFTSLAVGIAIDENLLRLDDRVMAFFPDQRTNRVSDNMAAMTVRDLLMMASGVKPDWTMRNNSTLGQGLARQTR
jgi:CubicO group peptidase (beta-lactamase class C family)